MNLVVANLAVPPAAGRVEPSQTRLGKELKHGSPLIGCRYDPSGRYVFAGAQDNTIQRWDVTTGERTQRTGHNSWVRGLAFQAQGKLLLSGDYQGRLLCQSVESTSPPVWSVAAHRGWVRAVAVSPDGRLCASCGNDHLVRLWTVADGRPVREMAGHDCHVYQVAFHPDGTQLVSVDLKGVVKHWNAATGALVREMDARVFHKYDPTFRADIGGARGIHFSADGRWLACSGITEVTNAFAGVGKPLTVLFDWAAGKVKHQLRPKEAFQGTGWGVVVHPAGYVIGVGGGNGGALWFWKVEDGQNVFTLKLPNNARDLDMAPDGKQLAVAFFDGAVRLYDITAKA